MLRLVAMKNPASGKLNRPSVRQPSSNDAPWWVNTAPSTALCTSDTHHTPSKKVSP